MKALQEVTDWDVPNHIYIFGEKDELIGYEDCKTGTKRLFNSPMKRFDKRYRKFKTLRKYNFTYFESDAKLEQFFS